MTKSNIFFSRGYLTTSSSKHSYFFLQTEKQEEEEIQTSQNKKDVKFLHFLFADKNFLHVVATAFKSYKGNLQLKFIND